MAIVVLPCRGSRSRVSDDTTRVVAAAQRTARFRLPPLATRGEADALNSSDGVHCAHSQTCKRVLCVFDQQIVIHRHIRIDYALTHTLHEPQITELQQAEMARRRGRITVHRVLRSMQNRQLDAAWRAWKEYQRIASASEAVQLRASMALPRLARRAALRVTRDAFGHWRVWVRGCKLAL